MSKTLARWLGFCTGILWGLTMCMPALGQTTAPAQIWFAPNAGEKPIQVRALKVNAQIHGFIANTRMELEFYNPNARVLEGEFILPLAAQQSVVGYELEVAGALRAGVVVLKAKARVAFENITRQRVDPGLAELTRGNVFRTRIYPIPARGSKRVAVSIEQTLMQQGNAQVYRFPLGIKDKLQHYEVRIEQLSKLTSDSDTLELRDAKIASKILNNSFADPVLELKLIAAKAPMIYAMVDAQSPNDIKLLARVLTPNFSKESKLAPKTIAIYFDASRSALKRDLVKEYDVLTALFKQLGPSKVALTTFRNVADPVKNFTIDGDASSLINYLKQQPLDGGTSFDSVAFNQADLSLIFTDADSTFESFRTGSGSLNSGPVKAGPVNAGQTNSTAATVLIYASNAVNKVGLARLKTKLNAKTVDMLNADSDALAGQILQPELRLQASSAQCSGLPSIRSAQAVALTNGQTRFNSEPYLLAWQCQANAKLNLRWQYGQQQQEQTLILPQAVQQRAEHTPLLRLWAAMQIDRMNEVRLVNVSAIQALATKYELVTEHTSLLVLETLDDYLTYDVRPRELELQKEFDLTRPRFQRRQDQQKQTELARTEALAAEWLEFQQWHAKPHMAPAALVADYAERMLFGAKELDNKSVARKLNTLLSELKRSKSPSHQQIKQWLAIVQKQEVALVASLPAEEREEYLQSQLQADTFVSAEQLRSRPVAMSKPVAAESVPESVALPAPPPTSAARPRPEMEPVSPSVQEADQGVDLAEVVVTGSRIKSIEVETNQLVEATSTSTSTQANIELKPYQSDAPYLARMRAAKDAYTQYLLEAGNDGSIGFYLDCAEYFYQSKDPNKALRVLSNIVELNVEDIGAVRIVAEQLRQWRYFQLALTQFEYALQLRAEEPQSYRDFALALADAPSIQGGDPQRALKLLWDVIKGSWDERFDAIQFTALHEFNHLLATQDASLRNEVLNWGVPKPLMTTVPVGLRVVMGWNVDNVDMDLWVLDPIGEWAYYQQKQTRSGGRMSKDFTGGYGPETFTIATPLPGKYRVFANFFADHQQKLAVPVSVYLSFQTPYGAGQSRNIEVVRRLDVARDVQEIGEFMVQ